MRVFDQRQAADTRADAHANLIAVFLLQIEAGVLDRIDRRSQPVMNESVEPPRFLGRQPFRDFKAFDFARDLAREARRIEARDARDP